MANNFKCIISIVIVIAITSHTAANILGKNRGNSNQLESSESRNGQCGGTIELDAGTLTYPGEGVITPGELCIWTIHLRTMDGFRMNFTHLDIPGQNSGCTYGSVTIYGLSNLIPSDDPERYKFCNENDFGGYHFLTGNIATVVFHTSPFFSPNGTYSGFALHWEGSRLQSVPSLHSSSYSSSESGAVWYPVEGEYPPNAAMTWLVNGAGTTNAEFITVDILGVDFENCSHADPCLCEAVIIYDISRTGYLHEVDRFCGERDSYVLTTNSDFIVAFYSDNTDIPGAGMGFQIDWKQLSGGSTTTTSPTTTTTTTEPPTTTTGAPGNITRECGGIIEGTAGTIEYIFDEGDHYPTSTQCVWTIRTNPPTRQIELIKDESYLPLGVDFITVGGIARTGLTETVVMGRTTNGPEEITMTGSVAIIAFASSGSASASGRGFRLHFRSAGPAETIRYSFDYNNGTVPNSISYPPGSGNYANSELSTFVMTKNSSTTSPFMRMFIDMYNFENSSGCTYDGLFIYSIVPKGSIQQLARYCGTSNETITVPTNNVVSYLMVLYSDGSTTGTGFVAYWNLP